MKIEPLHGSLRQATKRFRISYTIDVDDSQEKRPISAYVVAAGIREMLPSALAILPLVEIREQVEDLSHEIQKTT